MLSKIEYSDVIHFYRVNDLKNVKDFYEGVLDLHLYLDQTQCLIYDLNGYGKIGFCTHHPKKSSQSTCITFVYPDKTTVDAVYQSIADKITLIDVPKVNPAFNIYHFM